LTDIRGVVC